MPLLSIVALFCDWEAFIEGLLVIECCTGNMPTSLFIFYLISNRYTEHKS